MADLNEATREDLCDKFDIACPKHGSSCTLAPAPNEDMPNGKDYDFRCRRGYLFNGSGVFEDLLAEQAKNADSDSVAWA